MFINIKVLYIIQMKFIDIIKKNDYKVIAKYNHKNVEFGFNLCSFSNSNYERDKINEGLKEIENFFLTNYYYSWDNFLEKKEIIEFIIGLEKENYITFFKVGSIFKNREEIELEIENKYFSNSY